MPAKKDENACFIAETLVIKSMLLSADCDLPTVCEEPIQCLLY